MDPMIPKRPASGPTAPAEPVPAGPADPHPVRAAPVRHGSLAEQYAHMAHQFEPRGVDRVLRGLDIAIAGLALLITSPVILLTALVILVTSGTPVLYRGDRVGRAGQVFQMHKFRTLAPDAETRLSPYLGEKLTELTQSEVTKVGRILRVMHVDELPQLWDVLRGKMSIVGPRPIRPPFFEELCEAVPRYWQRLVVPPGVTGFAQTRMTRETTWEDKLAHDLEYIADRSPGLYLRLIAATAWRVVRRTAIGVKRTFQRLR